MVFVYNIIICICVLLVVPHCIKEFIMKSFFQWVLIIKIVCVYVCVRISVFVCVCMNVHVGMLSCMCVCVCIIGVYLPSTLLTLTEMTVMVNKVYSLTLTTVHTLVFENMQRKRWATRLLLVLNFFMYLFMLTAYIKKKSLNYRKEVENLYNCMK